MGSVSYNYRSEAQLEWSKARRKAFWTALLDHLDGDSQSADLRDFNEIERRLRLRTAVYRGLQNVPLHQIVGSMGRYQDFTGAFLPLSNTMNDRWQRVAAVYLDPSSGGVPPVELYKVGESYFVKDGNHRVSIANQLNMGSIEAYVWEYPEPVEGLGPDADIDSLLLEAEHREFLECTNLNTLRPDHDIRLTEPGGYTDLLHQIERYRDILSRIDERDIEDITLEEAVEAWYDLLYESAVQQIEQEGVLRHFPDRTPADFYVWVMRHKERLESERHEPVMVSEAARSFNRRLRRKTALERLWLGLLGVVRRLFVR